MKLILGSASEGKRNVLTNMGYDFEVMNADIDERAIRFEDPEELTLAVAHAKADALLPRIHEQALLITADVVVVCGGIIREKPKDAAQVHEIFRCYARHPAEVVAAVVVVNTETKKRRDGVDRAIIQFRPFPKEVIDALIADGKIFCWAGGFNAQDPPFCDFIEHFEGTFDTEVGLPRRLTERLIKECSSDFELRNSPLDHKLLQ